MPDDESLQAFYDRFLVRVPVAPVGDANFAALLALDDAPAPVEQPITAAEHAAVAAAAAQVTLGAEFSAACSALRAWLAAQRQPALSDRRWRQFVALARTAAASEGRDRLDAYDLWLAPYVASARPEAVPVLQQWFEDELLAAPPARAPWLERAVQAFEQQLQIEASAPPEDGDDAAGKLALARSIGLGERDDDARPNAQRIVSARLEAALRRHYSPVHIACRVAQVHEIEAQLAAERTALQAQAEVQARTLADRIWLPPGLRQRLAQRQALALRMLDALAQRLGVAHAGFAALPCDDAAAGAQPPAPVALEAAA